VPACRSLASRPRRALPTNTGKTHGSLSNAPLVVASRPNHGFGCRCCPARLCSAAANGNVARESAQCGSSRTAARELTLRVPVREQIVLDRVINPSGYLFNTEFATFLGGISLPVITRFRKGARPRRSIACAREFHARADPLARRRERQRWPARARGINRRCFVHNQRPGARGRGADVRQSCEMTIARNADAGERDGGDDSATCGWAQSDGCGGDTRGQGGPSCVPRLPQVRGAT
jgi:hypothetical protein